MQVLALADAQALVATIRGARSDAVGTDSSAASPAPAAALLAEVPTADLVLLGLSSNRGWIVVGAIVGLMVQLDSTGGSRWMPAAFGWLGDGVSGFAPGLAGIAGLLLIVLLASLLVRLLGVVSVLLRHYGFRLTEGDSRISVEGGLLTRTQSHTTQGKIQRWLVREPWLLRRFDRRALHVETAARRAEGADRGIDALLPVAPAARVDALLRRFLPGMRWEQPVWHGIHPNAWRRTVKPPLLTLAGVTFAISVQLGSSALLLLLIAPLLVLACRRDAAFSAYSVDADRVLWRSGWLQRRWQIIERERIQCVRLRQSAFDRRARMAHVDIDSAGARGGGTTLSYLPSAEAQQLAIRLRRWLSAPRLLAPEGRREQDQHAEHLETAEQHAEGPQPDRAIADGTEGGGNLAETRTEVGEGGDAGAKR
jgi:putative membrane protein